MAPTIVVLGAGFSGTVTAIHLLRLAPTTGLRVVLVNRRSPMARGMAYGTSSPSHLLNVPAGNMSALADDADHFLRDCQREDPHIAAASYVSRRRYGDYLERLLQDSANRRPAHATLQRVVGDVVRIAPDAARGVAICHLGDGRRIRADRVVLAFGHGPPKCPRLPDGTLLRGAGIVADPWAPGALEAIECDRGDKPVVLLGTGLTALDVATSLHAAAPHRPLCAVSRRGLLPQPHRPGSSGASASAWADALLAAQPTAGNYLSALRSCAQAHVASGGDWRDVIGALRASTPALWQRLPRAERARFIRHLQPYWDAHRHRVAPQAHAGLTEMLNAGRLATLAGRIVGLHRGADGLDVTIRARGSDTLRRLTAAAIVNCTGPSTDLRSIDEPLVRQLLGEGLIRCDALGLGIDVGADYRPARRDGRPHPMLRYVGPLLRARDWEATAVPELRRHAQALATALVEELTATAGAPLLAPG